MVQEELHTYLYGQIGAFSAFKITQVMTLSRLQGWKELIAIILITV